MATRNQGFTPATLAPDLMRRQMEMQRNQMMAQQLLQSEAPKGQMVSGHYVAPSITQHLAHALRQYQGNKAMNELPKQAMEIQQAQDDQMLSAFGFKPSPQQLAAGLSEDSPQAFPVGAAGQPSAAPAGGGSGPVLIPGMSEEQSFLALRTLGPQKYMELVASKGGPINVAPGGSLYNPLTGTVDFTAPKDGISIENGRAVPIPGYSEATATAAGEVTRAQEKAKAELDLVEVPDGRGGTRMMPRDQAVTVLGGAPATSTSGDSSPASGGLGTTPPKDQVAAREELPGVIEQADAMLASISGLMDHPGMANAVGVRVPGWSAVPGTEAANFVARLEQLQGQAFLQAFESLKGGGQITEIEGKKATDAIARLGQNQSEAAFKESLRELQEVLQSAKRRAYSRAGMVPPGKEAPASSVSDFSSLWGG